MSNDLNLANPQQQASGDLERRVAERTALLEAINRESEERYQRLLESVTDYVYTVEVREGRPVSTTHGPGCVAVTGYTAEDYAAEPYLWHRMVHDEDKAAVVEQAARILAGQAALPLEHRIVHKDGSVRWVRNTPVPRYDAQGRLVAYDGLITDITGRKRAEEALREGEAKYRMLVEASTDAIFLETLEGQVLDCNTAACKMYGYTKEELTRLSVADLVPGEWAARLPDLVVRQLADGGLALEALNKRKDGQVFPCDVSTRLITIGGEQRVIAYVRDITERKRAEEARLHEMEANARAAAAETARQALEQEIAERRWAEKALRYRLAMEELVAMTSARFINVMPAEIDGEIQRALQAIGEFVGADRSYILLSSSGTTIDQIYGWYAGGLDSYMARFKDLPIESFQWAIGQLRQVGVLSIPSSAHLPTEAGAEQALLQELGIQSVLALPMVWGGAFGGLFGLSWERPLAAESWLRTRPAMDERAEGWTDEDIRLFKLAAEIFANVLARKQAEEELDRRAAQLALINDVGKKIAAALDLDEVLNRATRLARQSFGYHHVGIFSVDREHAEVVLRAAAGSYAAHFPPHHRLKLGEGMVGWTAIHGKRRLANDVSADACYVKSFAATQAELCVPIRVGGETVGVLDVQSPQRDAFDKSDILAMETLADQVAVALENARLFEQAQRELAERRRAEEALRRRNEELLARNAIATTISQSFDLDHILNATLDTVLEVIAMDAGWMQLLEDINGNRLVMAAQRGFSPDMAEAMKSIPVGEGITGQVAQSGQPFVLATASEDHHLGAPSGRQEALHALAVVPIESKDRVLGVLGVFSRRPRELSSHEVQLLVAVGHQVGMAIDNVRLARQAAEIELLRELDRMRSELLANISHELRTPLGLIEVFCTSLLREDVTFDRETQREFLGDIQDETAKLTELVDNLLDLSRMQGGRLRLDKSPTDVAQLVRKVIKAMQTQLAQIAGHGDQTEMGYRSCRFTCDFSGPLMAMVDSKAIEQVLRNLLSNAVKYSPDGCDVVIQARRSEGQLVIQVSDHGMGIPPEALDKIFERFYRVENEATMNIRGAGLGLPVCRGIVEAHGGRIWAESTLGVGSTFYFTLPVGDEPTPPAGLALDGGAIVEGAPL